MLITIAGVLDTKALEAVEDLIATLRWSDGAKTAGATAREVKHNLQADLGSRTGAKLRDVLRSAIDQHPVFQAAAQPARSSNLLVSKTEPGGGYGLHVDNAYMPLKDGKIRADLSFTLFLSDPDTYQGGELQIEHAGQSVIVKPQAGDLVLYPSTSLHQVNEVKAGTRLACVGWIESRVRSEAQREILFDLENLHASKNGVDGIEAITLGKIIANLKRQFD